MALFKTAPLSPRIFLLAVLMIILTGGEKALSFLAGEKPQNTAMLIRMALITPPAFAFSLLWFARARKENPGFNERQHFLDLRRLGLAAWLLVYGLQWIITRQGVKIDSLASLPMLYLGCFWGLGISRFIAAQGFKNQGR